MIGIIPAAGFGTRINLPYPKELLPISVRNGRVLTVIESNLMQLAYAGISEAVIVVRPEKQIIKDYLGEYLHGVRISYVNQTTHVSREGLPDAVYNAVRSLRTGQDLYVMLMGDVFFTPISVVKDLVTAMKASSWVMAGVSTWITDQPHRFGIVSHEDRKVTGIVDKPDIGGLHPMWGAVAFRTEFIPFLRDERETMSNTLHRAATSRKDGVIACQVLGEYLDLGTPESFVDGFKRVNK